MIPVVTPEEMRAIDAAAPDPVDVLVGRAGGALARRALALLGGSYGRTVVVVAGKGNNGNDGREAARRLRRRGVRCLEIDASAPPKELPPCDLVIDAGYGTGFSGEWHAPETDAPVLACDIVSGLDAVTGEARGAPFRADHTVTFQALKPGLLLGEGPVRSGVVEPVDIGLDASSASCWLVTGDDVAAWVPRRRTDAHKWRAAVWVVGGSPTMAGAAVLAARAAQRAGAGMVRFAVPGASGGVAPLEAVAALVPERGWAQSVLANLQRCHALVLGPGLGRDDGTAGEVRTLLDALDVPVVLDGDGLHAVGPDLDGLLRRAGPTVLTPHDGELAVLTGAPPGADRVAAVRALAERSQAVVLLKGATTLVAEPGGTVAAVTTGDERLATAGTGDVLSGTIGALLANGADAFEAAAAGAWLHGRAAHHGPSVGLVAGELVDLLPSAFAEVRV